MGVSPTAEHIAAFATSVAWDTNARLLTADPATGKKTAGEFVPVTTAAASGQSFMVHVAADVLALDADCPESAAAADTIAARLRQDGHTPVVVRSGRPDGLHVFALLPNPDVCSRYSDAIKAMPTRIDVRQWIRPPCAPHPAGYPVHLLSPGLDDALTALTRPGGANAPIRLTARPRPLSPHMTLLLAEGDPTRRRYPSGSEVVQALATAAVQAGWTFDVFQGQLEDPANLGGESYRTRPAHIRARWLKQSWMKATRFVAANPAPTTREEVARLINQIRAAANTVAWPGKAGASDRAVLHAHLQQAEQYKQIDGYVLSMRDCADLSGVSTNTVRSAQIRLERAGWLTLRWGGKGIAASRWRINHPVGAAVQTPGVGTTKVLTVAHDAYQPNGLSRHTPALFAALDNQPMTTQHLAERVGLSYTTVWRTMTDCARLKMAVQDIDKRWYVIRDDSDTLRRVACLVGTDGTLNSRRDRHIEEQATQATWFESLPPTVAPDNLISAADDTDPGAQHAAVPDVDPRDCHTFPS